jgi:cytochrome c biogenesis protein CcmG/thiol:disulfide interchange protein DsbE
VSRPPGGANRRVLALLVLLPLTGLFALLAWGLSRSEGRPGGLGVNTRLGEVKVVRGPARDFSLSLFDGSVLRLADLRGKTVMVDFWASWCPPCRQEAPVLAKVYQAYQGKGVEFVGIAIWDTEKRARDFLRLFGVAYPNGLDAQGRTAIDYGVTGIPEKYFIDPNGVLVRKFVGPMSEGALRQILEGLLAGSPSSSPRRR